MNTHKVKVNGEDQDVSMEDLLDLDMSEVEESYGGFEAFPKGVYHFRCTESELTTMGANDEYLVAKMVFKVVQCFDLIHDEKSVDDMVDAELHQNVFIKDAAKDLGKVKGALVKLGVTSSGRLKDLMAEAVDKELVGTVKHSRNKNDPDNPYVNLDFKGSMSLAEFKEATA